MSAPDGWRQRGRRKRLASLGCCALLPAACVVLSLIFYAVNNRPVRFAVPTRRIPSPNAYNEFVRAGSLASNVKHKSPLSLPNPTNTFAEYEAAAKDARPAITALHHAFTEEFLTPPVRSYQELGNFPPLATFRGLARTLTGVAIYYDMAHMPGNATDARLDGLEMAVTIPRGGQVISGLVGVACEAIAERDFESQISRLSAAELSAVASRLDRIRAKRVSYADVLQEEGYSQTAVDVQLMNDPKGYRTLDAIRDLLVDDDSATGKTLAPTFEQSWEMMRFAFANKSAVIRENQAYNDALVAEARLAYKGRSTVPVPGNLLAQMRRDVFEPARAQLTAMEAVQSILRTEIALYRYKLRRGGFPSALTDLVPTYVRRDAIIDPFTGKSLHYRLLTVRGSYVLYSVGPDLKDDNGTASRMPSHSPGDIVAGQMWKRRPLKVAPTDEKRK